MFDIKRVNSKLVAALPPMLRQLTRCAPKGMQSCMLQLALNRFFQPELSSGELNFMQHKSVVINVADIGLEFGISLDGSSLQVQLMPAQQDLLLKAELADFIAMISNTTDPDTLFFRRRLQMLGDTELGLYCKNLLDSIGPERLPPGISGGLNWLAQQQTTLSSAKPAIDQT
ncbi:MULTISPECIES: ubiquinone anaerobic biosynthesis accessory factor UbiT [unclassified Arsukibacterium]|uniref:ubiquinone anaerobic biosynthesis accessory factor UbiT n=1 Tax=unclassified Arsukibacterium TaxID=2635278 RepID=UPI000C91442E|nr:MULTISPECIES: SCP2 sterol-binding domain-containing protein [unclassified Arsukibacterium]MAA93386.1 sterol-binding protein [Rheinheimera sp.]HAW94263.1 sterol-binding protein [Candidatus Azambacteria bacterium]|tara:strand:- start:77 stop:592 length:516 start_codon:yes stop_codon:yes gene_type:complete